MCHVFFGQQRDFSITIKKSSNCNIEIVENQNNLTSDFFFQNTISLKKWSIWSHCNFYKLNYAKPSHFDDLLISLEKFVKLQHSEAKLGKTELI